MATRKQIMDEAMRRRSKQPIGNMTTTDKLLPGALEAAREIRATLRKAFVDGGPATNVGEVAAIISRHVGAALGDIEYALNVDATWKAAKARENKLAAQNAELVKALRGLLENVRDVVMNLDAQELGRYARQLEDACRKAEEGT